MREEENGRSLFFVLALCARSRALASLASPPMLSKRTKTKKKQRLCTVYVCTATPRSRLEV